MAALVLRRASSSPIPLAVRSTGSSSSLIPLAHRSDGSYSSLIPLVVSPPESSSSSVLHPRNRLFVSRFSTNSPSVETSGKSPPVAFGTSDNFSVLHGLPFDSVERNHENGIVTLRRKTKDEIIEIRAKTTVFYDDDDDDEDYDDADDEDYDDADDDEMKIEDSSDVKATEVPPLSLNVRILYGNNFHKCFEAFCTAFPDDYDRIAIHKVSFSGVPLNVDGKHRKHLDELEDFFKKRGLEARNFKFLFDFMQKQSGIQKVLD